MNSYNGISTGVWQKNTDFSMTIHNKTKGNVRFYYWGNSEGRWEDDVDRNNHYFLKKDQSKEFKFHALAGDTRADYITTMGVKVEYNGVVGRLQGFLGQRGVKFEFAGGDAPVSVKWTLKRGSDYDPAQLEATFREIGAPVSDDEGGDEDDDDDDE